MFSALENNHAVNLANFDSLLARIVDMGSQYRPTKGIIQLDALAGVSHNARVTLSNVDQLYQQYDQAIRLREECFIALRALRQEIYSELSAVTAVNEIELYMLIGTGKHQLSQTSGQERYDFLLDNFCKLIKLLKINARYQPRNEQIQITSLSDFYEKLSDRNKSVKRTHALLANACAIRDEVMYRHQLGLVSLAATVKTHLKYHLGGNSRLYKCIAELIIKKERKI